MLELVKDFKYLMINVDCKNNIHKKVQQNINATNKAYIAVNTKKLNTNYFEPLSYILVKRDYNKKIY